MKTTSLGLMMLICAFSFGQDSMRLPAFQPSPPATSTKTVPRFDWKFAALLATEIGVTAWDAAQTEHCLQTNPACFERNTIYGHHPSTGRIYGISMSFDAGLALASYEWRRRAPRQVRWMWSAGMLQGTADHLIGIAQSSYRGPGPKPPTKGFVPFQK